MIKKVDRHDKSLNIPALLGRMINKPFATTVVVILGFVSSLLLSFFVYLQFKSIESLRINRLGAVLINALSPRMNLFGFSTMLFLAVMAAFMFAITFNKNLPFFKLLNMLGWKWRRINGGILLNFMGAYALGYLFSLLCLFVFAWFGRPAGAKYFDFLRPFLSAFIIALMLMVLAALATIAILLLKAKVLGRKTISVSLRNTIIASTLLIAIGGGGWYLVQYLQAQRPQQALVMETVTPTSTPLTNSFPSNLANYDLDLRFDPAANTLSGKVWVNFTNTFGTSLDYLIFRLYPNAEWALADPSDTPSFIVNEVKVDSEPIKYELSQTDSVLKVPLLKPLAESQKVSIEIDYSLRIDLIDRKEGSWWSSKAFYPLLAVYDRQGWRVDACSYCENIIFSHQGTYHLSLTHPENLQLVTNANQNGMKVNEDKTLTEEFDGILLRELIIGLSEGFTIASEDAEGFRINVATLKDQQSADKILERAKTILAYYTSTISPYPFDTFTLIASPSSASGGLAFSGGAEVYYKADLSDLEPALSNLVSRQWWVEAVGSDIFQAPWQSESLTIFSSWNYLRSLKDQNLFEAAKSEVEKGSSNTPADCALAEETSLGIKCLNAVQAKGSLAWLKLENVIGREKLIAALKAYYQTCQGKICSSDTLLGIIQKEAAYDFSTLLR